MQLSAPTVKYEVNLNTILLLVGFAGVTIGWGVIWGNTTSRISALETQVSERNTQQATATATQNVRIDAMDAELRKYDNLAYRVTVQEQGAASLAKSVEELKAAVNSQGADVRVIREILTRQDHDDARGTVRP